VRERLARLVAVSITGLLLIMAALFAHRRNDVGHATPPEPSQGAARSSEQPARPLDPDDVARGRAIFEDQACARCHTAEGRGNPRLPLDDVGARRSAEALREWVIGEGDAREALSATVRRAKERYREVPTADLDALVAYLSSLR
jgi:mono/diheme cytochrome c family protein